MFRILLNSILKGYSKVLAIVEIFLLANLNECLYNVY